ncbi:MAG: Ubiquinone/menaquinone biosynthesis C-methylase UbiE [Chloroflexi bacterium]|jgi:ubiquinone/menaquinone biosynthesis C-methylase UbiE|nr:MAG: Ubiquinone/menaquinone biosynthesis C-methylase UbiE [Chloroflexota bacterium]
MAHKFDPAKMERLTSDERRLTLDPDRIISMLPLRPYQDVADIGCGPGFFSLPFAKYLYDGSLYAVDTSQEMLDACQKRLEPFKFSKVHYIKSQEYDIPLEDASLDGVFLAFVLHEVDDRVGFLVKLAEKLKPSGWFVLLEWKKTETETGPPLKVRLDTDEARSILAEAGLRGLTPHDMNSDHYMIVGRK